MNWHRLFGLVLTDFFTDSPFIVELEKDLSLKQQYLDVVIIRRRKGRLRFRLPDGLDDLGEHNLVTFKSHWEALDDWALMELTGHLVNYRKQVSPSLQSLLPFEVIRLYAICSNHPQKLTDEVGLEKLQDGVYQCRRGTNRIRVIVASELPDAEHNAPLQLFSAKMDRVSYAAQHYQRHSPNTSSVLEDLFQGYEHEGAVMPYTMQDFQRDYARKHFKDFSTEEQCDILLNVLSPSQRRKLFASFIVGEGRELLKEILEALPREEIEKLLKQKGSRRRSSEK